MMHRKWYWTIPRVPQSVSMEEHQRVRRYLMLQLQIRNAEAEILIQILHW
jgi:hypothetical protein